jgi:hypothetical protein
MDENGEEMTCPFHRKLFHAVVPVLIATLAPGRAAAWDEPRGEIGVHVGGRIADSEIVPSDSSGLGLVYGIGLVWGLSDKWALFGDVNWSSHESVLFCRQTTSCSAYTPDSKHHTLRIGFERRFKRNQKQAHWYAGLGAGLLDVEWRGIQIHHGMISLSFGRRSILGPGALRWELRSDTGIGQGTDPSLWGALDKAHLTNVSLIVGYGWGFGGSKSQASASKSSTASD